MPKRYEPKEINAIADEMEHEGARAAITIGASLLEHALEDAIRYRLRQPSNKTEENVLFNEMGLLGSFNEKIWAAYFLGIIGPETRRDMDLVRTIRNEVAHNMNPISFETESIKARCLEIKISDQHIFPHRSGIKDTKDRFISTVYFMVASLALKSITAIPDEPAKDVMKIRLVLRMMALLDR
jgi:hypothetical protein